MPRSRSPRSSWVPEGAQGLVKDLRVRWALEEAGLDYRVRLIGGEQARTAISKDQPFNQVPCLRDDKVQIFESGAILQYIGEKSEALLPRDAQGRYAAIQWTYAAVNSVEPFVQHRVLLDVVCGRPGVGGAEQADGRRISPGCGCSSCPIDSADKPVARGRALHHRRPDNGHRPEAGRHEADCSPTSPISPRYVKRGEARPAFQQALSDQLAAFREHEPRRSCSMTYFEGFIVPVPEANKRRLRRSTPPNSRRSCRISASDAWSNPGTATFPKER